MGPHGHGALDEVAEPDQLAPWLALALWTYGSFTFGHVPYLELRFTIWQWLGAVAGINVHSVSDSDVGGILGDNPRFRYWYPAVTGGLRLLIVRETRSNLCLDYGVGKQGQHGFYLSFNEAF